MQAWSPEQIANRIKVDFPDDESMRISHEAIYQALYVESRGALKRVTGPRSSVHLDSGSAAWQKSGRKPKWVAKRT